MTIKNIMILSLILLFSPLPAMAVDCGTGGCKVCDTTTCSGSILNSGNSTFSCTNGYKLTCQTTQEGTTQQCSGDGDCYEVPMMVFRCDCHKDNIYQYHVSCPSANSVECRMTAAKLCTGM